MVKRTLNLILKRVKGKQSRNQTKQFAELQSQAVRGGAIEEEQLFGRNTMKMRMRSYPAGNCMLKINNRNTRVVRRRSGVFIVNFEHISHVALVFLLLTLKR